MMRFIVVIAMAAISSRLESQQQFQLRGLAQQSDRNCTPTDSVGYYVGGQGLRMIATAGCDHAAAPPAAGDPLAAYLFPPELIMTHQRELGLQDAQRASITTEIQKAQAKFVELQWKMSAETEHLEALLKPAAVDEGQVLEQIDRTLAVEREIKRIQVGLLVRIKNMLTASQQAKLAELRGAN